MGDRIAFIQSRLDAGTAAADRWSYGWFATFGLLSVGQLGVALGTTDAGLRKDMAVGAVSATLGVMPFALFPFAPRFAADELRVLPEQTPTERRSKLARAEALLESCAEAEQAGRGWVPQMVGEAVNVAWGLVLALGYHRVQTGVLNAVIGMGITELQIFTQPTAAIDDWQDYSTRAFRAPRGARGPSLSVTAGLGTVGLGGDF